MATLTFRGGVHPPDNKELSAKAEIKELEAPKVAYIPLSQHIGAPCKPVVQVGQEVKRGELIGEPTGFVSAPVHSSVAGKVTGITVMPNAMGRMVQVVVVENNGTDEWVQLKDTPDYMNLTPDELKEKIKDAGIVGMGGATFPTHVKLSPPKEKPIDAVIINGAECEPYLTADHRLMVERPEDVIAGLKVLMKVLGVTKGYVGIENNKPDAIERMKAAASGEQGIEVYALEVKYPQGAEKMLIKAILDRDVPAGGLPMDVGVVVQNVGTAVAVFEACRYGKPLIERVVTVTGRGVKNPSNFLVRIGTPISSLIDAAGGFSDSPKKVILGGPMMGFATSDLDQPVIKGTSGVLVLSDREYVSAEKFGPCIRCGRCIDACPMGLMPSMLSILAEKGFYEDTKEYNIMDCFECGTCTYVCPAKRPIVQLIRLAKSQVKR